MTFASKFLKQARTMTGDLRHRKIIRKALGNYEIARDQRKASYQDWQGARQLAAETKWEAVNHLDQYLERDLGRQLCLPYRWRVKPDLYLPGGNHGLHTFAGGGQPDGKRCVERDSGELGNEQQRFVPVRH